MKKLYWLLSFIIISVLFFQCQKENSFIGGPDTGSSVTPDPITTSIQGNITDENDQPAAGVSVTAGAGMTTTNDKGYFRFTNASLDKNTTLVTASKDGYFKGYRVFAATSGCNQVVIKLIKKDLAGTVPASSGGEASLPNGAKIKLPAGSIVTASSNSNYTGDVKVYASYINPKSGDINKTIPGSLVANNKNGKRVVLSSYGMLAVELSSASGEKLQIKSGSVATLTIPIPAASVASAPATLPLWYIDEATGIWQEEGTATKQGNNYVGTVKHFSFWNCDYPFPAVKLSLTLQTPAGLPLIYTAVRITATVTSDTSTSTSSAYGYTDSLGQVEGMVPSNESLKLEVLGSCGTAIYTQDISSLNQDINLGIIKITDLTSSLLTITGSLIDCNSLPVSNGYAIINFNGTTRYVITDNLTGRFTTTYVFCSGNPMTVSIVGVDNDAQQQSQTTTVNITQTETDAGTIIACGNSTEQFIKYNLDGIDYNIDNPSNDTSMYGITTDTSLTAIRSMSLSGGISFTAIAIAAGTYPMINLYLDRYANVDLESTSKVTFTIFPASAGSFYEGSLNGSFVSNRATDSAATHAITGKFRVRRIN